MHNISDKVLSNILVYTNDLYLIKPNQFNNKLVSRLFAYIALHFKTHPIRILLPVALFIAFCICILYGNKVVWFARLIRIGF